VHVKRNEQRASTAAAAVAAEPRWGGGCIDDSDVSKRECKSEREREREREVPK
jgi:hypothetical protein